MFPFIFRGALDVGATMINEEMKLACVNAIAALARKEAHAELAKVYSGENLSFGPDYLIPKPFDPRLIVDLPIAVAKAAIKTGVATRPIKDWDAYEDKLNQFFTRSKLVMRPIISRAQANPQRVVYCEGEEEKTLQAVQTALDEQLAKPILIGREKVVASRIAKLSLRLKAGKDFELVDPENDKRYRDYWESYHMIMERRGVTPAVARYAVRTNTTLIGALMLEKGQADAMICGTTGEYKVHLKHSLDVLGVRKGVDLPAAMNALVMPRGTYFFCDTQINTDPTIEELVEMTLLAADEVRRFGITPKVALLSHSNFGSTNSESAFKMSAALELIRARDPDLEIDGEMQADAALSEEIRKEIMPNTTLERVCKSIYNFKCR